MPRGITYVFSAELISGSIGTFSDEKGIRTIGSYDLYTGQEWILQGDKGRETGGSGM